MHTARSILLSTTRKRAKTVKRTFSTDDGLILERQKIPWNCFQSKYTFSVQSISKNQVQLNLPLNISGLWALFAMLFRDEARLELFVFFKIRFPSRVERGNFLFWQSRDSLRFFGGAAGWWCCCWWGCWSFAASRRLWWSLSSVAASTELEAATGVDCG